MLKNNLITLINEKREAHLKRRREYYQNNKDRHYEMCKLRRSKKINEKMRK
jgi:hypothetical protein